VQKKPKSQATTAKKQTSLDSFMNEESISKASSNAGAKNKPLDISDDEFVNMPKGKNNDSDGEGDDLLSTARKPKRAAATKKITYIDSGDSDGDMDDT